ncbi:hypothetical protein SSYRP_v1c03530 [Spiroplasma syrphidicola EA-1]|uniref:Uncharacterized protein n=1 Tax=Spiroplasma syrphidicola EA-1 TaxID=1276229 RepID=R4U3G4_9MOLU|nr:hypothetical protein [Spiroplasma syrphidicola]AGM25947.1 hypothetical protein SSYRP_v1c03530 [Spiroplasma syrphidicola EA-1]
MKNKMQGFYEKMCAKCQARFKQLILYIRKNLPELLKELQLFKCVIDKERKIGDDKGITPLALINCQNDSYVFLWKNNLFTNTVPKLPITNDAIVLSQETIDNITNNQKQKLSNNNNNNNNNNELLPSDFFTVPTIINSQKNDNINRHLIDLKRNMVIMNQRHYLDTNKTRRLIVIFGLVFLLIFASFSGFLGWYFLHTTPNISNPLPEQIPSRINLEQHLQENQLAVIEDNREQTILTAAKVKNKNLVVEDLLVKEISEDRATIYVKSSSSIYSFSSTVIVHFAAQKLTLSTHIKISNFTTPVEDLNKEIMLEKIKAENSLLSKEKVEINAVSNIGTGGTLLEAVLAAKANNGYYLEDEELKIYFSTTGIKQISDDLEKINIGDLLEREEELIIKAVFAANPNLIQEEVMILADSITATQAIVVAKEDSVFYVPNSQQIVHYRIFNASIGTEQVLVNSEFNGQGILPTKIIMTSDNKIIFGTSEGIYELDSEGKIIKKLSDLWVNMMLQITENEFLVFDDKSILHKVFLDGKPSEHLTNDEQFNDEITSLIKLQDERLWAVGKHNQIYQLNQSNWNDVTKIDTGITSTKWNSVLFQLENGTILFSTYIDNDTKIFELDLDGNIVKTILDKSIPVITEFIYFSEDKFIALGFESQLLHLNADGSFKELADIKEDFYTCGIKLNNGKIWAASVTGTIWELNSN